MDSDQPPEALISLRILLVDDHELVRKGVRMLLASDQRWEVCGEAKSGHEAVQKTLELTPDVVILDLSLPSVGGFDVATAIRQVLPAVQIIFFSMMETPLTAEIAQQGHAFVAKASASTDLPLALEKVLSRREGPPDS